MRGVAGNKDHSIFIPALFATMPISDRIHVGLDLFSPYGEINSFSNDWTGRYQLKRTAMKTVDNRQIELSPQLS